MFALTRFARHFFVSFVFSTIVFYSDSEVIVKQWKVEKTYSFEEKNNI